MSECRVVVVCNPAAGGGQAEKLLSRVPANGPAVKALAAACDGGDPGSWPIVFTTADESWKVELEAHARTRGVRTVLVIGGDGTLMQVASLFYGLRSLTEHALIAVPAGRGNDFARAIYGFTERDGMFWDWADRRTSSGAHWRQSGLDLASADGRLFLNMASIGYGGRVVENVHGRQALWSKTAMVYQVEGSLELFTGGDSPVDVKVDGVSAYTGPFFGAFVGNGTCNGRGLYWTRGARIDDGQLDAIVFPKPGMIDMLRTMRDVRSTADPAPKLPMRHSILRGQEIVFHFDRPTALELDGDFVGNAMRHEFKCLPRSLKIWVLG